MTTTSKTGPTLEALMSLRKLLAESQRTGTPPTRGVFDLLDHTIKTTSAIDGRCRWYKCREKRDGRVFCREHRLRHNRNNRNNTKSGKKKSATARVVLDEDKKTPKQIEAERLLRAGELSGAEIGRRLGVSRARIGQWKKAMPKKA